MVISLSNQEIIWMKKINFLYIVDNLPTFTLSYANGPGYGTIYNDDGTRKNLTGTVFGKYAYHLVYFDTKLSTLIDSFGFFYLNLCLKLNLFIKTPPRTGLIIPFIYYQIQISRTLEHFQVKRNRMVVMM